MVGPHLSATGQGAFDLEKQQVQVSLAPKNQPSQRITFVHRLTPPTKPMIKGGQGQGAIVLNDLYNGVIEIKDATALDVGNDILQ